MIEETPEFVEPILYPDGTRRMAALVRAAFVDGIPCLAGPVIHWHENGRLDQCDLAEPFMIGRHRFGAHAIVCFDDEGRLESTTVYETTRIDDRDIVVAPKGFAVIRFEPDGRLKEYSSPDGLHDAGGRVRRRLLTQPEVLDGVPCATWPVELDEAGRLTTGKLAAAHMFGDLAVPAESTFTLVEGRLRVALIPRHEPGMQTFTRIAVDPDGTITNRSIVGWGIRSGCADES